jgi:outer membrane protein TolC
MPDRKPFATNRIIRCFSIFADRSQSSLAALEAVVRLLFRCTMAVLCFWPVAVRAQIYQGGLLEAVMLALNREPGILVARTQLEVEAGREQQARAAFDTSLLASAQLARSHTPLSSAFQRPGFEQIDASNLSYSLGSSTRLRSGVSLTPVIAVDRVRDNNSNYSAPAAASVALRFTVPVLKGSGVAVNTASERAARENLQAAAHGYRHAAAGAINRAVNAYWNLLAAQRSQLLRIESEERSFALLEDARRLAKGDEIPPSDVLQYEAQLARDRAQRIAASQALETARATFAVAVGLDGMDSAALPDPVDDFPEWSRSDESRLPPAPPAAMPTGRNDLLALQRQLTAAELLHDALRRDSNTQLDLAFSLGYSGQAENRSPVASLEAFGRPASGLNLSIGLNYVLPVQGNERGGLLRQLAGQAEQARVSVQALSRSIQANIRTQYAALKSAARQLEQVRAQLRLQAQVFANERKKYALGQSTVLDVLTAEAQLSNDGQQEIDARRQLAQALINYRFETGTLLAAGADDAQRLSLQSLTTVPEAQ